MNHNRWRFEILEMTDAQALSRVMGYFAQRSIVPEEMSMRVACGVVHIAILTEHRMTDIGHKAAVIHHRKLVRLAGRGYKLIFRLLRN